MKEDELNVDASADAEGGCGCLTFIGICVALWALCFGVTIGSKHYQVGCSKSAGIEIGITERGSNANK